MLNRRKTSALIVAGLLLTVIVGTIVHFNTVNERNPKQVNNPSQISYQTSTLKAQISSLSGQLANLTDIVENLTSANLVTSLNIHEMSGAQSSYMEGLVPTPVPFNYLWIEGSVINSGRGYALDAGLSVIAYSSDGALEINLTLPFTGSIFGTDNATNTFASEKYGLSDSTLQILDSGQSSNININIFHEGSVANWTITPVCWNSTTLTSQSNKKNESLTTQISDLDNEISIINATITKLTTVNIVSSLKANAYPASQDGKLGNSLYIVGPVTNIGEAVAYNVGIHVVAYAANGRVEMNTTFPLVGTFTIYSENYTTPQHLSTLNSGYGFDSYSSSSSASIGLIIYTPDLVSNWTITIVWTNSP